MESKKVRETFQGNLEDGGDLNDERSQWGGLTSIVVYTENWS